VLSCYLYTKSVLSSREHVNLSSIELEYIQYYETIQEIVAREVPCILVPRPWGIKVEAVEAPKKIVGSRHVHFVLFCSGYRKGEIPPVSRPPSVRCTVPVDRSLCFNHAMGGMDPHSNFLTPFYCCGKLGTHVCETKFMVYTSLHPGLSTHQFQPKTERH
jgi:hypothetical protein